MRLFIPLLILSLGFLSACSTTSSNDTTQSGNVDSWAIIASGTWWNGATICKEGEILADTVCIPFSGTGLNIDLFGKNFDESVTTAEVSEGDLRGYYVEPVGTGSYPGIIMIHEWWGLNDNIKYMAELLASSGYKVFAIDLYGEVATTPERARELSWLVRNDPEWANQKMKLALDYLKNTGGAEKLGTLGWCFGGQQSLNISMETPVDATVIYYGNLSEDKTKLANLKWPVLWVFGDKDTSIPLDKITLFQENLNALGKQQAFYVYPGLGHAFANPSGANYASGQTVDAWEKTLEFLEFALK